VVQAGTGNSDVKSRAGRCASCRDARPTGYVCGRGWGAGGRSRRSCSSEHWTSRQQSSARTIFRLQTRSSCWVCVYDAGGRLEEAEELFKRALDIQKAKLGPNDLVAGQTLYQLGLCAHDAGGRLGEAEDFFKLALEIEKTMLGEDDPRVARTLSVLCVCVQGRGASGEGGRVTQASSGYPDSKARTGRSQGCKHDCPAEFVHSTGADGR
ncbi:unnamed protein product, partial [Ectocarpus fasciculatus]